MRLGRKEITRRLGSGTSIRNRGSLGKGPEAGGSNKGGAIQNLLHIEGMLLGEKVKDVFSNPNTLGVGIGSIPFDMRT